jgi:hypothetical protein
MRGSTSARTEPLNLISQWIKSQVV